MTIPRILSLPALLEQKSFFLLGPRSTGKTTLIRETLERPGLAYVVDLLNSKFHRTLLGRPEELEAMVAPQLEKRERQWVVIDEIQRIPDLLNEVHRLIEARKWRFLLAGSSARRLKTESVNLLGGRARKSELFPLTLHEIPNPDMGRIIQFGALPAIYHSDNPAEDLESYCGLYLKEEIQMEGYVRKLPDFSRFLAVAALSSGEVLNYTQIGADAEVSPNTVREYYQVLEDTLLGFRLQPWRRGKTRKPVATEKFYVFDSGVTNALAGIGVIDRHSDLYGKRFEQIMLMEVRAFLSYRRIREPLSFWRTKHQDEVDLVIGDHIAVEFKATEKISPRHLSGLVKIAEENRFRFRILVSHDPVVYEKDGILCLPYAGFVKRLWGGGEWF